MMPGPGISVMWHSRVRRCWFAWERRSTSRCERPAGQKKKRDAEHGECGTLLRRTRKNQKSGRDVREAGWTSLFQAVAEPFSGAWQQGVKAILKPSSPFMRVFACISADIPSDIAKMRLRLMQTDAHGIRRETRRGDIARLCRRPNAQQNRIQFFELWLNAKLASWQYGGAENP